jgi:beta-lactamase superfamily II metal-dependent hydrolase
MKPPRQDTSKKAAGEVRVRMYRMGLGDCFLLTFNQSDHMLIDCGVLTGTPGGAERSRKVAEHIFQETQGRLRALVATHEHWDHVSGFSDAAAIFARFTIDEAWVAWTEDPAQQIAVERKAAVGLRLQALRSAVEHLGLSDAPDDWERAGAIAETLNFFGGALALSQGTDRAMKWVTDPVRSPKYWSPGDVIERDWLGGIKIHVLGPPMDRKAINDLAGRSGDTYGLSGEELGLAAALNGGEGAAQWLPFDASLQWPEETEWLGEFGATFAQQYRSERWRRIDTDWIGEAEQMALQLDNATNNTSLVLAMELCPGGKVLLFPGDAQIGNWKSWAEKNRDLLARTVLYKVSHHASHNGTLTEHGLEAMTRPDLVVMIPVDERQAKAKRPVPWIMPADGLYEHLLLKTKGRILRSDRDFPAAAEEKPESMSDAEWTEFCAAKLDPLFIDWQVRIG